MMIIFLRIQFKSHVKYVLTIVKKMRIAPVPCYFSTEREYKDLSSVRSIVSYFRRNGLSRDVIDNITNIS